MTLGVLVVGAGLGGLCLAQGLRRAGVAVRVVERRSTVDDPGHAYRLRIDEEGIKALVACLPPELLALFRATCCPVRVPASGIFDHQLVSLVSWISNPATLHPERASAVTNRRTLAEILLMGLSDVVEPGRAAVRVDHLPDGVRVTFADGSVETADVVVAADGVDSVLRRQLLPDAEVVDTGLIGVSGQAAFDADLAAALPEPLFGGASPILAPDGLTLSLGVYEPGVSPATAELSHVANHVKWTLVGPAEVLAPATLDTARRLTADWHPTLARIIADSDPAEMTTFPIRAALPVPAWPTTRVTLLGDAIHATTAVGGSGASLALRDAALLTEALSAVDRGSTTAEEAIAGYEARMRDYGFAGSMASLHGAERLFRVYIPALA